MVNVDRLTNLCSSYMQKVCGFFLLVVLSGCVAPVVVEKVVPDFKSQIIERAEARWGHMIKGETKEAYAYLSPLYRSANSEQQYFSRIKLGLWTDAKGKAVNCSAADLCKVTVDIGYTYRPKFGNPVTDVREIEEVWRQVDGQWWFVPES